MPDRREGWVHSWETAAGQDGPGWRFVLYLAGCELRCRYCHNPDTWHLKQGQHMTAEEVVDLVKTFEPLLRGSGGGVTITGGEPLVQPGFVAAIFALCKQHDLHTALDTSGALGDQASDQLLADTDLVLLDIKSWDKRTYHELTGAEIEPTLRFARRLSDLGRPTWIRFVLVPGVTDEPANVAGIADFAATLRSVERIEVLPFHQMGRSKWEALGLDYTLGDVHPPTAEALERSVAVFRSRGLPVLAAV